METEDVFWRSDEDWYTKIFIPYKTRFANFDALSSFLPYFKKFLGHNMDIRGLSARRAFSPLPQHITVCLGTTLSFWGHVFFFMSIWEKNFFLNYRKTKQHTSVLTHTLRKPTLLFPVKALGILLHWKVTDLSPVVTVRASCPVAPSLPVDPLLPNRHLLSDAPSLLDLSK